MSINCKTVNFQDDTTGRIVLKAPRYGNLEGPPIIACHCSECQHQRTARLAFISLLSLNCIVIRFAEQPVPTFPVGNSINGFSTSRQR